MTNRKIAIAASLGLALAVRPALADDTATSGAAAGTTTRDRAQVGAHVRHMLTTEGQVSDQDVADVQDGIDHHAGDHGYGEAVSTLVHEQLALGCKGTCLADKIHAVNGAMDRGATASEAARAAARAHADARGADVRRDAARRDAARDRVRDRTQDRGAAGSHAMGAGKH